MRNTTHEWEKIGIWVRNITGYIYQTGISKWNKGQCAREGQLELVKAERHEPPPYGTVAVFMEMNWVSLNPLSHPLFTVFHLFSFIPYIYLCTIYNVLVFSVIHAIHILPSLFSTPFSLSSSSYTLYRCNADISRKFILQH